MSGTAFMEAVRREEKDEDKRGRREEWEEATSRQRKTGAAVGAGVLMAEGGQSLSFIFSRFFRP